MMKFKKDRKDVGLWVAERIVDGIWISNNEYVIEKDLVTNDYCLYVNGTKYSEAKTLRTVKKDADEHFKKSPKKVFA